MLTPDALYLIIAANQPVSARLRAFLIREGQVRELQFAIV
jgi:hypothetical protein